MSWTAEKLKVLGVNISKVLEISWTVEEIDTFLTPPHVGGFRGQHFKETKHQVLKSISGMQLSWMIDYTANIPGEAV